MFPTSTAVPSTFEAYMAEHNIPAEHPNLDGWRQVWQNELRVEATVPAVTPACPDWCTSAAGHEYTCYDGTVDGLMTHLREHTGFSTERVQVDATERNTGGTVTVDAPTVFLNVEDDLDAAAARAFAADLLAAADVLDRLSQ